jgi:hypothetical protein
MLPFIGSGLQGFIEYLPSLEPSAQSLEPQAQKFFSGIKYLVHCWRPSCALVLLSFAFFLL